MILYIYMHILSMRCIIYSATYVYIILFSNSANIKASLCFLVGKKFKVVLLLFNPLYKMTSWYIIKNITKIRILIQSSFHGNFYH